MQLPRKSDDSLDSSSIVKPQQYREALELAKIQRSGLTEDEFFALRRRCKTDLFFLCRAILKFDRLSPDLHGNMCEWLKQTISEQYREFLAPRGHYKSTVATIGDGIQIILPDDEGDQEWPRNLGTDCRLLICHEVDGTARRFLYAITQHITTNPMLMCLFPEIVPDPRIHRTNARELELPRKGRWAEPTIDTMGVGGRSQGKHYNYLKLDDLFGDKARDSEAERKSTYDWFDNILSFFSTPSRDKLDLIGTRWAIDDIYSHAEKMYGTRLIRYIRGCEERDSNGVLQPIFPEEFPPQTLQILKKKPQVWNAQYANDPREGGTTFDVKWRRYYAWEGISRFTYEKKRGVLSVSKSCSIRDCNIYILVDPAPKKLGGYIVSAVNRENDIFILRATQRAWKPPDLIEEIFNDVVRYQPKSVIIESVNFSEVYKYWLETEMPKRGIRFKIEEAKTKNREKGLRVLGLSSYYSAGQIYHGAGMEDLDDQFESFGAVTDYHLLDALAYGPEFWKAPTAPRLGNNEAPAGRERDARTGYSPY